MRLHGREMVGARPAQVVDQARRGGDERSQVGILRIEEPQRVDLQSLRLGRREGAGVRLEVGAQSLEIGRAALAVADRIQVDGHVGHAARGVEAQAELDQLRVDRRTGVADGLDVPLPELAIAARLRPIVAEHRAAQADAHRLRQGLHAVLEVGTHDAGGRLRPQRPAVALLAARRRNPEELLLHDIGRRADAALEDLALLEERRVHLGVAVPDGQLAGDPLQPREGRPFGGQQVAGATWRTELGHRGKSTGEAAVLHLRHGHAAVPRPHRAGHAPRRPHLPARLAGHHDRPRHLDVAPAGGIRSWPTSCATSGSGTATAPASSRATCGPRGAPGEPGVTRIATTASRSPRGTPPRADQPRSRWTV